ncbi:unnamed protein product [Spirodela intermedia]|uniref:Uncharacterized protein n=1 Tax=Spirodela intermedia TaxID=51605 RepID=A0A7I8IIC4_SPIIN|nr:unnamed protein product [Spirodela intermedia]CAA6657476.1 unnamed protein product [Spirodela intermedia]
MQGSEPERRRETLSTSTKGGWPKKKKRKLGSPAPAAVSSISLTAIATNGERTQGDRLFLPPSSPPSKCDNLQVNDLSSTCVEKPDVHSDSETPQGPNETSPTPEALEKQKVLTKSAGRLSRYGKKVAIRRGRTYLLRSSFSSSRVLRSMSKSATRSLPPLTSSPVNFVKDKRKRRRKTQSASNDEFSRTRKSVRYLLHRMSYEQNLIDAYAGEGWKGQSSEKIKPEMELQRAKSEIVRCKMKIRSLFQQLEFSIYEGKLDDSLFDSEGEICSEDIFCAKCKSMDVSAENDIILCDGICDRGFHQKCLNPHLLTDDIDCIDLINEKQGTDLSIKDEWKKVFPEVAGFGSEDGQHDNLGLPSDDSEDHDYDPDDLGEGSSSDESDFTSTSEDFGTLNRDIHNQNFGLPSDDSEDHEYDPERQEHNENSAKDSSRSDESDFTSDTDDLNALSNEISDANEASASPISKYPRLGEGSDTGPLSVNEASASPISKHPSLGEGSDTGPLSVKSALFSLESELGQENKRVEDMASNAQSVGLVGQTQSVSNPAQISQWVDPWSLKTAFNRQLGSARVRLACLFCISAIHEVYGNNSSDSSDDEEWADTSTPANLTADTNDNDTEGLIKSGSEVVENESNSKRKKKLDGERIVTSPVCSDINSSQKAKSAERPKTDSEQPDSKGKRPSLSSRSKYGAAVYQKLQESLSQTIPTRDAKESWQRTWMTVRKKEKLAENHRSNRQVLLKRELRKRREQVRQQAIVATICENAARL